MVVLGWPSTWRPILVGQPGSHRRSYITRCNCIRRPLLYNVSSSLELLNGNGPVPRIPRPSLEGRKLNEDSFQRRFMGYRPVGAGQAGMGGSFDIPAAPILIPAGPWQEIEGGILAPKGFKAQGMYAGLRASGKKADLSLLVADVPAVAAGVFTTNVMCAAPVQYDRKVLASSDTVKAVITNAGQANAATGDQGVADCQLVAETLGAALGVPPSQVLVMSTGVIGRRIKLTPLLAAIPDIVSGLGASAKDALQAAVAITTTDVVSKTAALETEIGGRKVRVGGMAKGSGMINPDLATLLGVVTTDAAVEPALWRNIVRRGAARSFNQITVDGDTSTNDTIIGLASGAVGGPPIKDAGSTEAVQLEAAVTALLQGLAKAVAWDGEGATTLLEVDVTGAADDESAQKVAKAVVKSMLVKSAIFGGDPNWGRIACAAGYSGVPFNPNELNIRLGDIPLMEKGQPLEFDAEAASSYLKGVCSEHGTTHIHISVGGGSGYGIAWGCDLSYRYVEINAEYTT